MVSTEYWRVTDGRTNSLQQHSVRPTANIPALESGLLWSVFEVNREPLWRTDPRTDRPTSVALKNSTRPPGVPGANAYGAVN